MINSTFYLSMVLVSGPVIGANVSTAPADEAMPCIQSRVQFNQPENQPKAIDSRTASFERMKQVEGALNSIPEVVPGRKTAPAAYACKLDSVITEDNYGMRFQKEIFEFSDDHLPIHRVTQKWDDGESKWYDYNDYLYEYDKEGYLVKFTSINKVTGRGSSVQTYEYDANHNLVREMLSLYSNGETTPYQKAEYGFDQWGQCIEEHIYEYDPETGDWNNVSWVRGELLPDGKQKWVEKYAWTGTKWKGLERKNYDYNEKGDHILFGESRWLDDTDEWLYYVKFERHYRDDGQTSLDEQLCWNPDKQDWSGLSDNGHGSTMYNTRTVYTYDDQDRIISEEAYTQQDNGEMLRGAVNLYEWSEPSEGIKRKRKISCLCDETGENLQPKMIDEIFDYNSQGEYVYWSKSQTFDAWETSQIGVEQTLTYEEDGVHLRDTEMYEWDENGTKYAAVKEHYEYDSDMNCVLSDYWQGQGTPDWLPYSHFTYEYENGVRTRKFGYFHNGTEFRPTSGEGWDWDFTVPFARVLFWQAQGDFPAKVDSAYSFYGNGAEWGYQALRYYYTPLEDTSVDTVAGSRGSMRLEGHILVAGAADASIDVYDMTGRRVAAGIGSADMRGLQSGLYVGCSGGESFKFMLR